MLGVVYPRLDVVTLLFTTSDIQGAALARCWYHTLTLHVASPPGPRPHLHEALISYAQSRRPVGSAFAIATDFSSFQIFSHPGPFLSRPLILGGISDRPRVECVSRSEAEAPAVAMFLEGLRCYSCASGSPRARSEPYRLLTQFHTSHSDMIQITHLGPPTVRLSRKCNNITHVVSACRSYYQPHSFSHTFVGRSLLLRVQIERPRSWSIPSVHGIIGGRSQIPYQCLDHTQGYPEGRAHALAAGERPFKLRALPKSPSLTRAPIWSLRRNTP